jgi:hypothetical protein
MTQIASKETTASIVDTPSSLEGQDPHKLEYIKAMLELVREDIRHVMLYITFAVGIDALFLSQLGITTLRTLPLLLRIVVCCATVTLLLAAVLFFRYVRALHTTQMKMTRCLVSLDVPRVRELWAGEKGVWKQSGLYYKTGLWLVSVGVLFLTAVILYILIH